MFLWTVIHAYPNQNTARAIRGEWIVLLYVNALLVGHSVRAAVPMSQIFTVS